MKRKENPGHASRKRRSDSSTVRNSGGSPKRTTNSAARSRANFLASPRTEPCERRSNSARLLKTDQPRRPTNKKKKNQPAKKSKLLLSVRLGQAGLVYPGIAHRTGSQSHSQDRSHTQMPEISISHTRSTTTTRSPGVSGSPSDTSV